MQVRYLPGLNGLRFIAAFFVLISHAHQSAEKLGILPDGVRPTMFDRGGTAVEFFFTLSGFLITYILLNEYDSTGRVSLKRFYLRRVCRIWPLYYLILAIGFVLLGVVYPRLFHTSYIEFPVVKGLLLYIFFLPNFMNAFYRVGMLFPLWSIGIEEQFYLFWAPLVKLFRSKLFVAVMTFTLTIAVGQISVSVFARSLNPRVVTFLHEFKFHYMGVGALFACILCSDPGRLLSSWLTARWFQVCVVLLLVYHYLIGLPDGGIIGLLDLPLACLYAALIINVSMGPRRLLNLEWQPLSYLGKISYGIYMFHMTIDYALRSVFARLHWTQPGWGKAFSYGSALLALTILTAAISYRYLESPILSLGSSKPERRTPPLREQIPA